MVKFCPLKRCKGYALRLIAKKYRGESYVGRAGEKRIERSNISLEKYFEHIKREPSRNSISIEENVLDNLQNEEIMKAINKLTYLQRETIIKYFYQEESLRQIARERGVNEKTVRECYHSAIKKLGVLLKDLCSD